MIAGEVICVVGAGLITRMGLYTSTVSWAAFLVITGIGMGMGMQLPYTAVQIVLRCVAVTLQAISQLYLTSFQ